MRYMLCYFNCNEYLVSDIWDVSLYNDQFREIKVDEYFFYFFFVVVVAERLKLKSKKKRSNPIISALALLM